MTLLDSQPDRDVELEVRARPKERPRFARNGHPYMPKPYMEWKNEVSMLAVQAMLEHEWERLPKDQLLVAHVELSTTTTRIRLSPASITRRPKHLTGDLDNYVGGVLDAIQGSLIANDSQVVELHGIFRP